jgi:hypothetical protein
MNATSQVAAAERSPSHRLAAIATLALITVLAFARAGRGADLDVATLRGRLHDTAAIGFVAKLGLRHDIERLLAGLAAFHAGRATVTLDTLRAEYRVLVARTVALLTPRERELAHALAASSERIWIELVDPSRFAALAAS